MPLAISVTPKTVPRCSGRFTSEMRANLFGESAPVRAAAPSANTNAPAAHGFVTNEVNTSPTSPSVEPSGSISSARSGMKKNPTKKGIAPNIPMELILALPAGSPRLPSVPEVAGEDREQAADLKDGNENASHLGAGRRGVAGLDHLLLVQQWYPDQRPVGELRGKALHDQEAVRLVGEDNWNLVALDVRLLVLLRMTRRGELWLPEAAWGIEGEQVEHAEAASEHRDDDEWCAEIGSTQLAGEQAADEPTNALGDPPETHGEPASRRTHEVADHREPDRGDRAEPDGRHDLPAEEVPEVA